MNNVVMFSTADSRYFANLMAKELKIDITDTERKVFGGGEKYFRLAVDTFNDLIGKTAIIVGSTHTDENLNEIIRVGSALRGYGTTRRIFIIPFFGYSTMERATNPGEIVTAKIIARQLSALPGAAENYFYFLDLHAPGIVHYFEGDCMRHEISSINELISAMGRLGIKDPIIASADLGRPVRIQQLASIFGSDIALISKERDFEETKVLHVMGDVKGKIVIIYDDMTRSAGTIIKAVKAYLENGAKEVFVVLSHFAANNDSIVNLLINSPIRKIIITNSHPMSNSELVVKSDRFEIVDIASNFAEKVKRLIPFAT